MSKRLDCWRRSAVGLSVAFFSAVAAAVTISTALAQDQGSWSAVSTMPTGTGDSAVAALDGKIYIFGGSTFRPHILPTSSDMGSGTWGSTVNYEYDPKTDRWRERAPLPIGLSHPGAVGLNGKLYVFGGFTNLVHANAQIVALAYDPATDKWQELAPMSTALGAVAVATVDGKIHAFGGRPRDPLPVDFHEAYDPATNQWSKKAPMPKPRDHHGVAVIDGKIHVVGGRTGGKPTTSPTTTSMIQRRTNGQRQRPCRPPVAAGRPSIIMACCSISVASAGSAIQMPSSAAVRLLTRTKPTIRNRILG